MQLNQNYPWYLQTSPVFTVLYEGVYNVTKNVSSFDAYKIFYPEIMADEQDANAALNGLNVFSTLWQFPTEVSAVAGALIYDMDNWSDTKKWSGGTTGISIQWLLKYIKTKCFIYQQPLSLQLIHDALDILFEGNEHTVTVTESANDITINVHLADSDALGFFQGLLVVDPTIFGKPIGATITYLIV